MWAHRPPGSLLQLQTSLYRRNSSAYRVYVEVDFLCTIASRYRASQLHVIIAHSPSSKDHELIKLQQPNDFKFAVLIICM